MKRSEQLIGFLELELKNRSEVIVGLTNSRDFWREKAIAVEDDLAEARKCAEIMQKAAFEYQAELAALKAQEPAAWIKKDVLATLTGDECCYAFGKQNPVGNLAPLYAAPVVSAEQQGIAVSTNWLKRIHRDLDACQKLIWANLRGCDPSYYEDAQERLREIDAMLAAAPAPSTTEGQGDE